MESSDQAGANPAVSGSPRSRLADIADQTVLQAGNRNRGTGKPGADVAPGPPDLGEDAEAPRTTPTGVAEAEAATEPALPKPQDKAPLAHEAARARGRFLARLGEFRRSQVLVPVGPSVGRAGEVAPLTVDMGGVRWILAFTGEPALARFAAARREEDRKWPYRGVWGAALLDAAVPTVAESGMPCGVLVDAADGARGLVLPPVVGVVPEEVAVVGPGALDSSPGPATAPGPFDASPGVAAGSGRQEER